MSFEVAALHTTIGVKLDGVQDALRFSRQIEEAQKAIGVAAGNSSAQVQKLTNDLQAAVTKLQSFSAEPAKIAAEAQALGTSIQTLSADLAKATSAADQQQARLDELKKTYAELNAQLAELDAQLSTTQWGTAEFNELNRQAGALSQQTAVLKRQIEEEAVATAKLRAEQQALAGVQQKLIMLPVEETKAAANVERLTGSLNKLTGATKGADVAGARFTQTLSTGLVTAVRSGSIGASVLGQALQFLASKAGVLAVVAGAVGLKVFQMGAQIFQAAEMMTGLRASTLASVDALRDLEGISLTALAQSVGEISNRMESFGGNQAAAQNIVRIGTALSFLDDKADNAAETIRMVEQALQGSTEGLRSLGLPVNELTRLQQEAKESGKDIRALTAEWLAAQAEMRQGLIGEQMENEERTLAGVGRAIRDIVSEAANTQQMRDAIEALAGALQNLLPIIEAVANFISNNLAKVITFLSDPIADFRGELDMLNIMFLRTRANLQFWASEQEKREWRSQADKIEAEMNAVKNLNDATKEGTDTLADYGTALERAGNAARTAADRQREYSDAVSGGFQLIGGIRNLAQALTDMQDGATKAESFAFVEQMWSNLESILNRGSENTLRQFRFVRDAIQEMFSSGLISERDFNQMIEALKLSQAAADPLIEQAKKIEQEHGNVASAADTAAGSFNNNLIPSVQNSETAFNNATTAIQNTASSLAALDGTTVTVGINVVQGGGPIGIVGVPALDAAMSGLPGGFAGPSFGRLDEMLFGGILPGTSQPQPRPKPRPKGSAAAGRLGGGSFVDDVGIWFGPIQETAKAVEKMNQPLKDLAKFFDLRPRSRGGGGGGGRNDLASIEDIRQLFRNIGQLIKIGTQGGVFFSAAGNAIPLGGPNEFINTQGGVRVQTVNIRGIWDFADPAAKRQIIRELEEALEGLKRETR